MRKHRFYLEGGLYPMKKKLFLLAALPLMMGSLVGCGNDSDGVRIGILTLGFEAVDVAADGFLDELSKAGIAYNAIKRIPRDASDRGVQALDLASQCDYLLGLGTDNSKSLKSAVESKGKAETTTLFFTAVTDPVAEGLVPSKDNGRAAEPERPAAKAVWDTQRTSPVCSSSSVAR